MLRKIVSYLPLLLSVIGVVYGAFDPTIYTWIDAHHLVTGLGLALLVSETLAATDVVKSNSLAQAIFDFVDSVLKLVLRKTA
jgi:hypothetical protein